MPDPNHEALRRIFDLVFAAAPADRNTILDRECGHDADLRTRLGAMLAAISEDRFLSQPTRPDSEVTLDSSSTAVTNVVTLREAPGTRIGPYKLLQLIGEGGFGSVFMAEQERPVARKVALKIIKLGMDTQQVVARFEQERQALAVMDHPNIAKVLDAGATETGRPFFVMELVKGEPIVEYCDKHSLNIKERLELILQVCHAVQHAHGKGIIHRDIKPSNVLVSTQDGAPHAKVIDFGIAKATQSKLTERTLFTQHRELIGTPEYMSPEQAEGSLDIDTQTDVYSLGVLLYELLTGSTPFSGKDLRSAAYAEIQRIIREVDPPKPSTRLSDNAGTLASVAALRRTEPRRLGLMVRGELDWIVMKALEKNRKHRYETPSGLAADIGRYLSGEPVVAAPPSKTYQLKKFVRRNRGPVAAASVVGLALIVGVIGTSIGMRQAIAARAAERARADGEAAAKQQAEQRLRQLENATDLLASVFKDLTPQKIAESGRPLQAVLADRVDNAIEKLQGDSTGDPLTVASLQATFANSLLQLGQPAKAVKLLERAIDTRTKVLGADDLLTLRSMNKLVAALSNTRDLPQAEALARDVIRRSGDVEANRPVKISTMKLLGPILMDMDKTDEAMATARQCIDATRELHGADSEEMAVAINALGYMHQQQGEAEEAVKLFEQVDRILKITQKPDHPDRLTVLNNLASGYWAMGKLDRSIPIFEELQNLQLNSLGPDHPRTRLTSANLGVNYASAGRYDEAITRLELACNAAAKNRQLSFAAIPLLKCYVQSGRTDAAKSFGPRLLSLLKATETPGSPAFSDALANAAAAYFQAGMMAEAVPFVRELDAMRSPELWQSARSRSWLAEQLNDLATKNTDAPMEDRVRMMNEAERLVLEAVEETLPEAQANAERVEYQRSATLRAYLLFKARHKLEPDKGYDQKASEWKKKALAAQAAQDAAK